ARERPPLEVLHDVEVVALGGHAEIVDLDDVLAADPVDRLRLLVEALDELLVVRELAVDDIESDLLSDQGVFGEVHGAHAAGPDLVEDAVIADRLAVCDQRALFYREQNWS